MLWMPLLLVPMETILGGILHNNVAILFECVGEKETAFTGHSEQSYVVEKKKKFTRPAMSSLGFLLTRKKS